MPTNTPVRRRAATSGRSLRSPAPPRRLPAAAAAGGPSPAPRGDRSRRTRRRSRRRRGGSRRGGVAAAGPVGIGVVQALQIPAAVAGKPRDRVPARGDQLPKLLGRAHPTRKTAGHAHDRDRLLRLRQQRRGGPARGTPVNATISSSVVALIDGPRGRVEPPRSNDMRIRLSASSWSTPASVPTRSLPGARSPSSVRQLQQLMTVARIARSASSAESIARNRLWTSSSSAVAIALHTVVRGAVAHDGLGDGGGLGWSNTSVEGNRSPVVTLRRLRSSTAVERIEPELLERPLRSQSPARSRSPAPAPPPSGRPRAPLRRAPPRHPAQPLRQRGLSPAHRRAGARTSPSSSAGDSAAGAPATQRAVQTHRKRSACPHRARRRRARAPARARASRPLRDIRVRCRLRSAGGHAAVRRPRAPCERGGGEALCVAVLREASRKALAAA